jgi:TolB-like protein
VPALPPGDADGVAEDIITELAKIKGLMGVVSVAEARIRRNILASQSWRE